MPQPQHKSADKRTVKRRTSCEAVRVRNGAVVWLHFMGFVGVNFRFLLFFRFNLFACFAEREGVNFIAARREP